jgi:hypothetical protein
MAKEDKPKSINTGGGAYFGGKVEVHGGNVIGGDQYNIGAGAGSINQSGGTNVEDLLRLLGALRQLLPQAVVDDDTRRSLQEDVVVVVNQLEKPEPKKEIVLPKLKGILETITTAASAGEALQKMAPMAQQAFDKMMPLAQQALQMAQQFFK